VTSNKFVAPKNVSFGIAVSTVGIVTVIKPVFWNTAVPILKRDSGNLNEVNAVVPLNALFPNVVTVFGTLTVDNELEFKNALLPIFVSAVGNVTFFNAVVPLNTSVPIVVNVLDNVMVSMVAKFWKNPLGISVSAVDVKFTVFKDCGRFPPAVVLVPPNKYLKKLSVGANDSRFTVIESIFDVAPAEVEFSIPVPMEVTVEGIVSDVKLIASKNTLKPMVTKPFGKVTEVNRIAPLNVSFGKIVTLFGITIVSIPLAWNVDTPSVTKFSGRTTDLRFDVPLKALL
jgi:hypothetical protein